MGVIYKARQIALNRLVAIKMLIAGAAASAVQNSRFRAEALVLARVRHPQIVHIHDVGTWEGKPYLVMEYVEGHPLAKAIADAKPYSCREAARFIEELARVVQHLHDQDVIHRDIKPANILLVRRPASATETDSTIDPLGKQGNHPISYPSCSTSAWPKPSTQLEAKPGPAPSWVHQPTWLPSRPTGKWTALVRQRTFMPWV
jgi:serine/threonine protein kinase